MDYVNNLIIGAGPAGLAMGARLRKLSIDFEILEASQHIAYSWTKHYDRLCLHTVKQLSALPYLPFPESYDTYVAKLDLIEYYHNYVKHFDIQPKFEQSVVEVLKEGAVWKVKTQAGKIYRANQVIMATGTNRVPYIPRWTGMDKFKGNIIHSRSYKNPTPFINQKVLIIGFGNTGAEIALDLAEKDVQVAVSVRNPAVIVPRDINGRPVQVTARTLDKLPLGIGGWIGNQIRKIAIGDLSKYGLQLSKEDPVKMLRKTGKSPVIDLGTVAMIKARRIHILPDVKRFTFDGVVDTNEFDHSFDQVILATGYQAQLGKIVPGVEDFLDKNDFPLTPIGKGKFQGLYFLGFDNYRLGGILGTINQDSESIAQYIQSRSLPQ